MYEAMLYCDHPGVKQVQLEFIGVDCVLTDEGMLIKSNNLNQIVSLVAEHVGLDSTNKTDFEIAAGMVTIL